VNGHDDETFLVLSFVFALSFLTFFFLFLGLQSRFCTADSAYCSHTAQGYNHSLRQLIGRMPGHHQATASYVSYFKPRLGHFHDLVRLLPAACIVL
jgi:hypothetical protein